MWEKLTPNVPKFASIFPKRGYHIPRDIRLREIQYLNYRSDRYIVSAFQSYGQYVYDKITEEEPMEINQHSCCGQGALFG